MIDELVKMIIGGVVGNFSYDKFRKFFREPVKNNNGTDSDRVNSSFGVENAEPQNKVKKVPNNIEFGTALLRTPSLEEMGIPVPFAYMPYIRCHVQAGDWVDRGDLLISYTLVYYHLSRKLPLFLRLIFGDKTYSYTVELESPISGFVTDLRKVACREQNFTEYAGTFLGMIDDDQVLPTLLIPRDEPAWNHYRLSTARSQICNSIVNNWELNQHNLGGGEGGYKRMRLRDAIALDRFWGSDESYKKQLSTAMLWAKSKSCSKFDGEVTWPVCEYSAYKTSFNSTLLEYIEWYRAKDYSLRDKFVHLVHLPEKK